MVSPTENINPLKLYNNMTTTYQINSPNKVDLLSLQKLKLINQTIPSLESHLSQITFHHSTREIGT